VPSLADAGFVTQCRGTNVLSDDFEPRPVFGMAPIEKKSTSLTTTKYKLLRRRERAPELYDLEADPYELHDVAAQHPDIVEKLGRLLAADVTRQEKSEKLHHRDAADASGAIDATVLQELRELGYGAGDDDDGPPPPAPKPKDGD